MKSKVVTLLPIMVMLTACNFTSNPVGLDPTYEEDVLTSFEEHPCYELFKDYGEIESLNPYTDYYYFRYAHNDGVNELEWTFGINSRTLEMSIKTLTKDYVSLNDSYITYDCGVNFKWGNFKSGNFYAKIEEETKTKVDDFKIDVTFVNLVFNENTKMVEVDRDNFYEYNSCSFVGLGNIGDGYVQKAFTKLSEALKYAQKSVLETYTTDLDLF